MDFLKALAKYLLTLALVFAVLAVVLRLFYVDIVTVGDNSMAPTLLAGEQVVVWRLADLEVGDVALCEKPVTRGAQQFIISRIIAQSGHQIATVNGALNVSGRISRTELQQRVHFYNTVANRAELPWLGREVLHEHEHQVFVNRVPPFTMAPVNSVVGFYMLGDNRVQSTGDSRAFGPAIPNRCRGRVVMRWSVTATPGHEDDVHRTHAAFDPIH